MSLQLVQGAPSGDSIRRHQETADIVSLTLGLCDRVTGNHSMFESKTIERARSIGKLQAFC